MKKFYLILLLTIVYITILGVFIISQKKMDYSFATNNNYVNISDKIKVKELANLQYHQYNHASSIAGMNNKLFITWYSGDKETAPNTDITLVTAYKKNSKWQFTKPKAIMTLDKYQKATRKKIHHLGNPSIFAHNKKLWLFFTTSSGGWSTSAINIMHSDNLGETWSKPIPIISTATFNYSSLTRGNAISLKEKKFALPIYNEFKNTNSRWLIFDKNGELIDISEMTNNNTSLQPVVAPITDKTAIAFYRTLKRSKHNQIYTNITNDGGKTWHSSKYTELNNPDSGIATVATKNGILLSYNDSKNNRDKLTITYKPYNDSKWKTLYKLENNNNLVTESSYPSLISLGDRIYLTYSYKEKTSPIKSIKIIEISEANND